MKTIEKISLILKEREISNRVLAEKCGLQPETIIRVLHGKQKLTDATLRKIADALDMDVDDIVEGKQKETDTFNVAGYIEYRGEIVKITNLKKLEQIVDQIKYDTRILPAEVKEIKRRNAENAKLIKQSIKNTKIDMNVNLREMVEYDAEKYPVYGFKTGKEETDNIKMDFGNQCAGYPFEMHGHYFHTSESAYLCGQFSLDTPECRSVQEQLKAEVNGFNAKKRIKNNNLQYLRGDWKYFNAEWMLYVIWCKVKGNPEFAKKLLSLPTNCIITENSTTIHEDTSIYWGTKNHELEEARDKVAQMKAIEIEKGKDKGTGSKAERIQRARDEIQFIGTYKDGHNYMGKILKICQTALLNNTEPDIPYDLFRKHGVWLLGEKIF